MRNVGFRRACLWMVAASLAAGVSVAENIDPDHDQSQYAWSENAGWINAEPSGNGGPGVEVHDFALQGWMWGENIGWISLSCENDEHGAASCDDVGYGVKHDGAGALSGLAWSENAGWIDFSPTSAGVTVDVTTGEFGGHAWGENVGWISFRSVGSNPFVLKTSWNCDPPPGPPAATPVLDVGKVGGNAMLTWTATTGATGGDVVHGGIGSLHGGLASSVTGCIGENVTANAWTHAAVPSSGDGFWYLVRGTNCGGTGTQDTGGAGQTGPRDAVIAASGADCLVP